MAGLAGGTKRRAAVEPARTAIARTHIAAAGGGSGGAVGTRARLGQDGRSVLGSPREEQNRIPNVLSRIAHV